TQLFIRRRAKGLTLTAAGQDLVVRARDLLDRANELTLHIGNVSDVPRGPVKVGCYSTLAATVVSELWARVTRLLPEIQLDIEEGPVEVPSQRLLEDHLVLVISYLGGLTMALS